MAKVINRCSNGVAGFTLLEVLVAVVVLSVGLLGLASLQVNGLRFNHSAYLRTQATLLAYELADRMRANRAGFTAGNYTNPSAAQAACRTTAGCTPAQMAQNDLFEWQQALGRLLPDGQGVVCLDSSTPPNTANDGTPGVPACDGIGNSTAIKVWWDDNRDGIPNQRFVVTLTQ